MSGGPSPPSELANRNASATVEVSGPRRRNRKSSSAAGFSASASDPPITESQIPTT